MRVPAYCRVSTEVQRPETQLQVLRRWAEQQGHTVTCEYLGVASSARRREKQDDVFEAARHRRFDILAIWSLDRLTKEGPLATLLYVHRLNALGIKVCSHQEPYLDRKLPFYESIVALVADSAKWERDRRSERTKAGLRRALASGKKLGRPLASRD